ncbi:hypothetical protein LINPERPRIM_LOCUS16576 [Linum perenne]
MDECVVELDEDGELQLMGNDGRLGWRSGTSAQGVERLVIMKNGNFWLTPWKESNGFNYDLRFEPPNRACDSTEPQTTSMKIKPHRVLFIMWFGAVRIKKIAARCDARRTNAHP